MQIIKPRKPYPKGSSLVIFGADQPQYLPLPALRLNDDFGTVRSCWYASLKERIRILLTGRIYLELLTYDRPIQPQRMFVSMEASDAGD